jgi:hypothetical protein
MSIKNITYLDLIEACGKPGCLVCTLRDEMVAGYIRMLFREHINDPLSRDKLRDSHGLCYRHDWLAVDRQLGNALGMAIISHDVIGKLLKDLSEITVDDVRFAKLKNLIPSRIAGTLRDGWFTPGRDCPACLHQGLVEARLLKTLVNSAQKRELQDAIRNSDGLCLPHLRHALMMRTSPESVQALLDLARDQWEKLDQELAEFIRKNDYRFSKEGFGNERDSWLRAATVLKGNRPKYG